MPDPLEIEDLNIKQNGDHQLWGMIFADMGGCIIPQHRMSECLQPPYISNHVHTDPIPTVSSFDWGAQFFWEGLSRF